MTRVHLSAVLMACTLPLAGCGSGPGTTESESASFAKASQAQREAAVNAADGILLADATAMIAFALVDNLANPDCPARTDDANTITFTGKDCTGGATQAKYSGSLMVTGLHIDADAPAPPRSEPRGPLKAHFEKFRGFSLFGTKEVDGTLEVSEQGTELPSDTKLNARFTGPSTVSVKLSVHCEPKEDAQHCLIKAGSEGELEGVGTFLISGDWLTAKDQSRSRRGGSVLLTGKDVLKVDFSAMKEDCAPMTIDGKPTKNYCVKPSGPTESHPPSR